VVEHSIGNGEVDSSILSGSTSFLCETMVLQDQAPPFLLVSTVNGLLLRSHRLLHVSFIRSALTRRHPRACRKNCGWSLRRCEFEG